MRILGKDLEKIEEPLVAAIGFFDGVHRGHQFLLEQIKTEAKMRSLASAVVTFTEHPRKTLYSSFQPALLCSYEEKIRRIAAVGIEYCIPLEFTSEMSQLTAREFMKSVLKEQLNVDTLVIGYDHRFGYNRTDGFAQYVKHGRDIGMTVVQAHELDTGEYVSSSHIRKLLQDGEMEAAAHLLTYNYQLSGTIVDGHKIGRMLGFPTANIAIDEPYKATPAYGAYAAYAYIDSIKYEGMVYIGKRPTIHTESEIGVEVHIFDLNENLYGKKVTVELLKFMRKDSKFQSVEILKRQLEFDADRIKKYLHSTNS